MAHSHFFALFFFLRLFHIVHTGLNSVSLGHIVLTVASQSQHGLAPVSLSELTFPFPHWSSCPGCLSVLGVCRAISFLRGLCICFSPFPWIFTNLDLYHFSHLSYKKKSHLSKPFPYPRLGSLLLLFLIEMFYLLPSWQYYYCRYLIYLFIQ